MLERALEQAEWRRLVDRGELERLSEGSRLGAPALRAALAEPLWVTRSVLERRFLKIVRRHKLPMPQGNVMVCGYEVDFFWPEHRLIVETDGGEHHGRGGPSNATASAMPTCRPPASGRCASPTGASLTSPHGSASASSNSSTGLCRRATQTRHGP